MKIGILTFHRAINYGAVLQCFALYETLSRMGHQVEVIDYRPKYIEKYRHLYYWNEFIRERGVAKKVKYLLSQLRYFSRKRKSIQNFDKFLENQLTFSHIVKSAKEIPADYDYIFFGSDQIWNPRICEGFDPIFYGDFPKIHTKFVSYAASLGTPQNIKPDDWKKINSYLTSFDYLSVRENKLADYINADIDVETVLDPTLLAVKGTFDEIAKKPVEEKYVLLYMLEHNASAHKFAKRIADEKNCKLIVISALPKRKKKTDCYQIAEGISVQEFLGYYKYADVTVNISFHGTAFSIIFHKNFYTLKSNNFERALGLLDALDLKSRFVDSEELVSCEPIDYRGVDEKLEMLRKKSNAFILNAIESR